MFRNAELSDLFYFSKFIRAGKENPHGVLLKFRDKYLVIKKKE
jgi:hypothetical protein